MDATPYVTVILGGHRKDEDPGYLDNSNFQYTLCPQDRRRVLRVASVFSCFSLIFVRDHDRGIQNSSWVGPVKSKTVTRRRRRKRKRTRNQSIRMLTIHLEYTSSDDDDVLASDEENKASSKKKKK